MKKRVDYSNFERISSNMARKFGTLKKGQEEMYSFILLPMESNLLKVNRIHNINNGRRVIEAIHLCLFTIDGYLNQIEYDLSKYVTNDNKLYTEALLMSFDPFTNEKILKVIEEMYDLNSVEDLCEYFATPVKCLLRLEKSIVLWTKEYGANGYFNFIEQQLGQMVENDDEMNFSIEQRKE